MNSRRSKVSVVLAALILLLTLALGPAGSGMAARDGYGLMAPVVGGGSGT